MTYYDELEQESVDHWNEQMDQKRQGMSIRRLAMEDYYLSTIIKERQLYSRWSSVFVSHTPAYAMFSQL